MISMNGDKGREEILMEVIDLSRRRQQRRDQFVYEWPDEFSQGDR